MIPSLPFSPVRPYGQVQPGDRCKCGGLLTVKMNIDDSVHLPIELKCCNYYCPAPFVADLSTPVIVLEFDSIELLFEGEVEEF